VAATLPSVGQEMAPIVLAKPVFEVVGRVVEIFWKTFWCCAGKILKAKMRDAELFVLGSRR
jgi:hypothetical protein